MSHAQVEKGVPPVNAQEPRVPGQDTGIDIIEPRQKNETIPNNDVVDDATLNMDTFQGTGERPSYSGLRGDRLIWGVTFFATMGFSVSRLESRVRPQTEQSTNVECVSVVRLRSRSYEWNHHRSPIHSSLPSSLPGEP